MASEPFRKGQLSGHYTMVWGLPIFVRESRLTPAEDAVQVALVHGLNVSSRHMIAFAEWMAPYYRMLAPDQSGYGKSAKRQAG